MAQTAEGVGEVGVGGWGGGFNGGLSCAPLPAELLLSRDSAPGLVKRLGRPLVIYVD